MTTDTPEKDNHLKEAIEKAGGYELKKPAGWDTTKTIDKALGESKIKFYPELPKIEWFSLVNKVFRILTIKIIEEWTNTKWGTSSFPLFLVDFEDGRKGTTLGSGVAILNQAKKLVSNKSCPVKVILIMKPPESASGQPYYFLDVVK